MSHITPRLLRRPLSALLFAASLAAAPAAAASQAANPKNDEEAPVYKDYKGVTIGMTAAEARKKLGEPTDKSDQQDFYVVSENETVQVFYDADKKVFAVSVLYASGATGVPTAKAVLGADVEPQADGRVHRMVQYPKAGYWVSYSRSGGDAPVVTVTMQKKQ